VHIGKSRISRVFNIIILLLKLYSKAELIK
jgi:hypothetical protein